MYLVLKVILFLLLVCNVRAQPYSCSCSCCFGQNCQPTPLANVEAQQCTADSCLQACRTRYYQCQVSPPNGKAMAQCLSTTTPSTTGGPYSCRCECCNTGSYLCATYLVGYATAYSCQTSACSIACAYQYPNLCVNSQFGQTQGLCLGLTTTVPTIG